MPFRLLTLTWICLLFFSACSLLETDNPVPTDNPQDALPTSTPTILPSKPVQSSSNTPQATQTAVLTSTVESTSAETLDVSQVDVESISAPGQTTRFRQQAGTPANIANFVAPEAGCNWMGVGGQAFDVHGIPVTQLVVEVGGVLEGRDVFHLILSGGTTLLGPGGFVIQLADHPIASNGTLWILLYDLAGLPLTEKIYFSTFASCEQNFILVNFLEVSIDVLPRTRLPLILR